MPRPATDLRRLILDTALDIIEAEGMKALTQPKIARRANLRQSHLTYYFPRKADLYIALLEASHDRASRHAQPSSVEDMLAGLMFDRERMRFFLSIILEVGDDPELQAVLRAHASGLADHVAPYYGRCPGDAAVIAFVDERRGIGIRLLLSPADVGFTRDLVTTTAEAHGLLPRK